jgi:branched-chain amino acid transport system substrate-binding protein
MKRIITTLVMSSVIVAACGGGGDESAEPGKPQVNGVSSTEIVIGTQNDLSGPAALLGTDLVNAARMRFDAANEAGGIHGRNIRFVVEDSQYQLPKAIQTTNKLVNRDKIFAMFLSMGTPMNNAIMDTLFEAGIPNLFPVSGGRQMVEPFRPMMFTGRGVYYDEIRAGVRYFVDERGAKNICVMYQDSDYGIEIFEGATDQAAAMGMELTAVTAHKPTDTEFTAQVLKLRNAECDTVMLGTIYKDTMLIFEAARKIGWDDVSFVGQNASYSRAVAAAESGAAEGYYAFVHLAAIYEGDDMSPEVNTFFTDFKDRFGNAPGYAAIEGYRNADVLIQALEKAGPDLTAESLIAALESISDYEDIFGYHMTFGPDDHKGVDESILMTVKDGRWVKLAESITY